jgi:hypothetical protein
MRIQSLKISFLFLTGFAFTSVKSQTMYVRPNTGIQTPFPVDTIQKLTFSDGNLLVTSTAGANGTFVITDNRYINFTDLTLGSTTHELAKNSFYLYPNPSSTTINVANDDARQTISRIEIISLEGRVLIEQKSPQVEIVSLPTGMYFCKIAYNNISQTIKFLKQ